MYAKLFSRITESSLMEEPIDVRYTFVMLLAVCDPTGHVIGTDIAIARRINLPLDDFRRCIASLMEPDEHSNSKEEEGRRVVHSDGERGYKVVNYLTYRDMRDEEQKRDYMRQYMRSYRERKTQKANSKTSVKSCKPKLGVLDHAEAEVHAEAKAEEFSSSPPSALRETFDEFWKTYPKRVGKADAEKAWSKHGCQKILPQILVAVRDCKISHDWTKEAGQFIPHPATWLNRRGWEDELLAPKNGKSLEWLPSKPSATPPTPEEEARIRASALKQAAALKAKLRGAV